MGFFVVSADVGTLCNAVSNTLDITHSTIGATTKPVACLVIFVNDAAPSTVGAVQGDILYSVGIAADDGTNGLNQWCAGMSLDHGATSGDFAISCRSRDSVMAIPQIGSDSMDTKVEVDSFINQGVRLNCTDSGSKTGTLMVGMWTDTTAEVLYNDCVAAEINTAANTIIEPTEDWVANGAIAIHAGLLLNSTTDIIHTIVGLSVGVWGREITPVDTGKCVSIRYSNSFNTSNNLGMYNDCLAEEGKVSGTNGQAKVNVHTTNGFGLKALDAARPLDSGDLAVLLLENNMHTSMFIAPDNTNDTFYGVGAEGSVPEGMFTIATLRNGLGVSGDDRDGSFTLGMAASEDDEIVSAGIAQEDYIATVASSVIGCDAALALTYKDLNTSSQRAESLKASSGSWGSDTLTLDTDTAVSPADGYHVFCFFHSTDPPYTYASADFSADLDVDLYGQAVYGNITIADLPGDIQLQTASMRDEAVAAAAVGWDFSIVVGTGDYKQPQYMLYKNSAEWIRKTLTWGADDNVESYLLDYSSDSGSNYDTVGTYTYTYTGGYMSAGDWS